MSLRGENEFEKIRKFNKNDKADDEMIEIENR